MFQRAARYVCSFILATYVFTLIPFAPTANAAPYHQAGISAACCKCSATPASQANARPARRQPVSAPPIAAV